MKTDSTNSVWSRCSCFTNGNEKHISITGSSTTVIQTIGTMSCNKGKS